MSRKKNLGAGFRRRDNGRIEYRFTDDQGNRHSVSGATVKECMEKWEKKFEKLERSRYKGNAEVTLDQYFEEWTTRREGVVKEATCKNNLVQYRRISPVLGSVKVCALEPRQIKAFRESLKDDCSTSYINGIVALLKNILNDAVLDELIPRNPCVGIKPLKRSEPEVRDTTHRALTVEETEAFFGASERYNAWYHNLYVFLINTGCRIGAAGALTWRDVDFGSNLVHIRRTVTKKMSSQGYGTPKTKSSFRDIPLTEAARKALQSQAAFDRDVFGGALDLSGIVFRPQRGGMLMSGVVAKEMTRLIEFAGIKHFSLHAFRATFATRAIESGMNPQTLKEILGHSSFSMTMDLYGHVMESTKQSEMGLIRIPGANAR